MRSMKSAFVLCALLLVPSIGFASEYDLEDIDLVNADLVSSLDGEGVRTTIDLLKQLVTPAQREAFAKRAQLDVAAVQTLALRLELMQIQGVGAKAAELLSASGIKSCKDLASRNAAELLGAMLAVNAEKAITGKDPDELVVADWIEKAGSTSIHLE